MALSDDDRATFARLENRLSVTWSLDDRRTRYYEGSQRLEHIGLAVPPELRRFETIVNWPRLTVDSLEERLDVRSFILPGADVADPGLQEGWDANNLDSESSLVHLDALIQGRGFVTVGANDPLPLIAVESAREMAAEFDPRTRKILAALKLYGAEPIPGQGTSTTVQLLPKWATLYLPDSTIWLVRDGGEWEIQDRDDHNLGRVPVVAFINRRRAGHWIGASEMDDVVPLTDAAARSLTNLQIAGETHSVPQKWVLGMSKGDFVDADGQPIPAWQAYFSAIWASGNGDAKIGQFSASDLRNFHDTVNHYAGLVSGVTGLPMRYLGQASANPPSADGIRADEARLVKRAERKQRAFGDAWGDVMSLYARFRDGEDIDGNRVKTEWFDAGTPTYGARVDGVVKQFQAGILSRAGAWDEMGWSEARKAQETANFAAEAADPMVADIVRQMQMPSTLRQSVPNAPIPDGVTPAPAAPAASNVPASGR